MSNALISTRFGRNTSNIEPSLRRLTHIELLTSEQMERKVPDRSAGIRSELKPVLWRVEFGYISVGVTNVRRIGNCVVLTFVTCSYIVSPNTVIYPADSWLIACCATSPH